MKFNTMNGDFNGTYIVDTSINQPTILYMNDEIYYPHGSIITVYD